MKMKMKQNYLVHFRSASLAKIFFTSFYEIQNMYTGCLQRFIRKFRVTATGTK